MDTRHKGEIALLKVQQRAAEKGFYCSKPTMEGCRYDLIVDDGKRLWRAQAKYAGDCKRNDSSGSVRVGLAKRSSGGNGPKNRLYTREEIDVVIAYIPRTEQIVWLAPEVWERKRDVHLRVVPAKNKQARGILFAKDFEW